MLVSETHGKLFVVGCFTGLLIYRPIHTQPLYFLAIDPKINPTTSRPTQVLLALEARLGQRARVARLVQQEAKGRPVRQAPME